jgi:trehalose-phosphatase
VSEPQELPPLDARSGAPIRELPTAEDGWDAISASLSGRMPVVCLDFDGTLSPIVDDPSEADLPGETKVAIAQLRQRCPVVIVSGRDTDDVRDRVGIDGLVYAGSHGFDVVLPDGSRERRGEDHLDLLDRAEAALRAEVEQVSGVEVERKGFAVAVHYRRTPSERVQEVLDAVERVAAASPGLRQTGGKKVLELRPATDWDKGQAVLWVLEKLDADSRGMVPVYVGDDVTDEDAFAALDTRGIGVVVQGEDDGRPTLARWRLRDVSETGRFLERLASLVEDWT